MSTAMTIKKSGLILMLALSLAACSGGGEFEAEPVTGTSEILVLNDEVEVFPGDTVSDPSGNAEIRVRHEASSDRKFVTLLSGSAELVRSGSQGG